MCLVRLVDLLLALPVANACERSVAPPGAGCEGLKSTLLYPLCTGNDVHVAACTGLQACTAYAT